MNNNNLNECILPVIMRNGYTVEMLSGKLGMSSDELMEMFVCPSYQFLKEISDILEIELWELLEIK